MRRMGSVKCVQVHAHLVFLLIIVLLVEKGFFFSRMIANKFAIFLVIYAKQTIILSVLIVLQTIKERTGNVSFN